MRIALMAVALLTATIPMQTLSGQRHIGETQEIAGSDHPAVVYPATVLEDGTFEVKLKNTHPEGLPWKDMKVILKVKAWDQPTIPPPEPPAGEPEPPAINPTGTSFHADSSGEFVDNNSNDNERSIEFNFDDDPIWGNQADTLHLALNVPNQWPEPGKGIISSYTLTYVPSYQREGDSSAPHLDLMNVFDLTATSEVAFLENADHGNAGVLIPIRNGEASSETGGPSITSLDGRTFFDDADTSNQITGVTFLNEDQEVVSSVVVTFTGNDRFSLTNIPAVPAGGIAFLEVTFQSKPLGSTSVRMEATFAE